MLSEQLGRWGALLVYVWPVGAVIVTVCGEVEGGRRNVEPSGPTSSLLLRAQGVRDGLKVTMSGRPRSACCHSGQL